MLKLRTAVFHADAPGVETLRVTAPGDGTAVIGILTTTDVASLSNEINASAEPNAPARWVLRHGRSERLICDTGLRIAPYDHLTVAEHAPVALDYPPAARLMHQSSGVRT